MSQKLKQVIEEFRFLFEAFAAHDQELYLVGGAVRDALMGVDARFDFDFTTNARPDTIKLIIKELGLPRFSIGARFGTIGTRLNDLDIEITTYRVEETYTPGDRKPEVRFGDDLIADLKRRDLSTNAIAVALDGVLQDPYNGAAAIDARILEVPGGGYDNTRSILADDPLRILRIARFAAKLMFRPTDVTTRAALDAHETLLSISRERWKMEIDKLLVAPDVTFGLRWLAETRALQLILPCTATVASGNIAMLTEPVQRARDGQLGATAELVTKWAILLLAATAVARGPVELPTVRERRQLASSVSDTFKFSNADRKLLGNVISVDLDTAPWPPATLRRWVVSVGRDACEGQIAAAIALTDDRTFSDRLTALDALIEREGDPTPNLPRGFGTEAAEAFEIPRGPGIGRLIQAVQDLILDGELPNGAALETYLAACHDHPTLVALRNELAIG